MLFTAEKYTEKVQTEKNVYYLISEVLYDSISKVLDSK